MLAQREDTQITNESVEYKRAVRIYDGNSGNYLYYKESYLTCSHRLIRLVFENNNLLLQKNHHIKNISDIDMYNFFFKYLCNLSYLNESK